MAFSGAFTYTRVANAVSGALSRGEVVRISSTRVSGVQFQNATLRTICREGRFLVWPNGRVRPAPGRAACAVLKGVVECGDQNAYFGPGATMPTDVAAATAAGFLDTAGRATRYGVGFHQTHLACFPATTPARHHADWPWDDLSFPDQADPLAVAAEIGLFQRCVRDLLAMLDRLCTELAPSLPAETGGALVALVDEHNKIWKRITARKDPPGSEALTVFVSQVAQRMVELGRSPTMDTGATGQLARAAQAISRRVTVALDPDLLVLPPALQQGTDLTPATNALVVRFKSAA